MRLHRLLATAVRLRQALALGLALVLMTSCQSAPAAPPLTDVNTPAAAGAAPTNANIERKVQGRYAYLTLSDGELRGRESFTLIKHPDGVRTATAVTDIFSRDVHVSSTLVVDADFRPRDAFVTIYTQGQLKGRGRFRFEGTTVSVDVDGPYGRFTETADIPEKVSLVTHPIVFDGWHFWYVEDAPIEGTLVFVEGEADFGEPMSGRLMSATLTPLGRRTVTVPAGQFEADGYRIADHSEIWVATEDRLVVRYVWASLDREYVLTEIEVSE